MSVVYIHTDVHVLYSVCNFGEISKYSTVRTFVLSDIHLTERRLSLWEQIFHILVVKFNSSRLELF